jgi:thiazole synthase
MHSDPLVLAGRAFASRLIVGTGKYPSVQVLREAHQASGAEMVTVAVRRVDLGRRGPNPLTIDPEKLILPPPPATPRRRPSALPAWAARHQPGSSFGSSATRDLALTPRPAPGTRVLVQEGFVVLPGTTDDVVVAKQAQDAGAAAVMPLGAPIGAACIQSRVNIQLVKAVAVPVIVDAGVGTASDAIAMGADGVLGNTAIARFGPGAHGRPWPR